MSSIDMIPLPVSELTSIRAVLSQDLSDVEHPIAFLSRKLLPREQNYSTAEKE
jgi:hypothetical protein